MISHNQVVLLSLMGLALVTLEGCWFGRKKNVPVVPPPPTVTTPPATTTPPPTTTTTTPPPATTTTPPPVRPPATRPSKPKPASQPAPTVPAPKPVPDTPAPATPAEPAPAFGEILTPAQQAQYRRAYEQSALNANQLLAKTSGRALSRDQLDTANRVRSFLKQASDSIQASDPATAAQLARRAELLAASLVNSLP